MQIAGELPDGRLINGISVPGSSDDDTVSVVAVEVP